MDFNQFQLPQNTVSFEQALNQMISSIADEEQALAAILVAEAKKLEDLITRTDSHNAKPSVEEMLEISNSFNHLIDTILMKEWLLLKKLEKILLAKEKAEKKERREGENDSI